MTDDPGVQLVAAILGFGGLVLVRCWLWEWIKRRTGGKGR